MKKFPLSLILCILISLLASCNKTEGKVLLRNQKMVYQAEAYINTREFDRAKEYVELALKDLNGAIDNDPENPHLRIVRGQALLTLFRAENYVTFDKSTPRPRNLMQLPRRNELVGLENTLVPAAQDLLVALDEKNIEDLEFKHQTIAHTTLAHIYRLDEKQLANADIQYEKAIRLYEEEYRKHREKISSRTPYQRKLEMLRNQIHYLILSQVEVNLLAENWPRALGLLEKMAGKQDLKFFATQFPLIENKIQAIENKMAEIKASPSKEDRGKKLVDIIRKNRKNKPASQDSVGVYEALLLQTEINLTDLINNLKYRIICYNNLSEKTQEAEARRILRMYFPQLDAQFDKFKQFQ
ncbi:MAG: hypothetical protein GWP59_00955 [Chlamydiales bacterium]|nr:hypothetical protein [Chlamydiales bacterium]NCF70246.1 hypothetical protein [Chlamydiales bacterium]